MLKISSCFSQKIVLSVSGKSGYRCCNPDCRRHTVGPNADFTNTVDIGSVCFICAPSPEGPRFDRNMPRSKRFSEDNGILLCQECAIKVELDESSYPADLVRRWKRQAIQMAYEELGLESDMCPPSPI